MKKWVAYLKYLFPILFLCLQIPFLEADPDFDLTGSRGPWADEGQYTVQARDYVQQGDWAMASSDATLKTPLFSLLQYVGFSVFGVSMLNARLMVLLFVALALFLAFYLGDYFAKVTILAIPLVFSNYFIFQYAHFSLAEMPAICCVWLSLGCFLKSEEESVDSTKSFVLGIVVMLLAVLFKLQFAYMLLLVPLYFLLSVRSRVLQGALASAFRRLGFYVGIVVAFSILLYFLWLKPQLHVLNNMLASQVDGRFISYGRLNFKGVIMELIHTIQVSCFEHNSKLYSLCFIASLILGFGLFFAKTTRPSYRMLFLLVLSWLLLEGHKLFILHVPSRYLLSLYFPMGLMLALISYEVAASGWLMKWRLVTMLPIAVLVGLNTITLLQSTQRRTYAIQSINGYIKAANIGDDVVLGQWAPTLTWQIKSMTYPYIEGIEPKIKANKHCRLLVTEEGEEKMLHAMLQGLSTNPAIDSTVYRTIGHWKLQLTWLKPQ